MLDDGELRGGALGDGRASNGVTEYFVIASGANQYRRIPKRYLYLVSELLGIYNSLVAAVQSPRWCLSWSVMLPLGAVGGGGFGCW